MSFKDPSQHQMRLYDGRARRLYINAIEREAFILACKQSHQHVRAFGLTLLYTGCRISEALALTPEAIQGDAQRITFRTLKRRRKDSFREVPIPPELVRVLAPLLERATPDAPIWRRGLEPLNRSTAYRWIKWLMVDAEIYGAHASPKGLRHGFGIHALHCGIPLNMLQKWMGHADMTTTSIYADACGAEEQEIARRMWVKSKRCFSL